MDQIENMEKLIRPDEVKVTLVLGGSLFPLHRGHLVLLEAAREYITSKGWLEHGEKDKTKVTVDQAFVMPTHLSNLKRKLPGFNIVEDPRVKQINTFLKENHYRFGSWISLMPTVLEGERNIGFAKAVSNLRERLENHSKEHGCHKVVQVCGCDSKVSAIINNTLQHERRVAKKNGKKHVKGIMGIQTIFVRDNRQISQENEEALKSFKHVVDLKSLESFSEWDLLPRSSTIQRFVEQDKYGKQSEFDPNWLIDTGINLGRGRQGIVRLMLLGADHYVAVKVFNIKRAKDLRIFNRETAVWKHLSTTGPEIIPRFFASETFEDFGYIVTELALSLLHLFPKLEEGKDAKAQRKDADFEHFFAKFNSISDPANLPFEPPLKTSKSSKDIKLDIFESLTQHLLPGLQSAGVLHRDFKVDNLLYLPEKQSVVICDFGVAFINNEDFQSEHKLGARGCMRYYPIKAVDDEKCYEPWCDEYASSLIMWEILMERRLWLELSTGQMLQRRREHIVPEFGEETRMAFTKAVKWIERVWKEDRPDI